MAKKSKDHTLATQAGSRTSSVAAVLGRLSKSYPDAFDIGESEKRISTGFLTLDTALGGGVVEGRIVESFGNESSGKSTLAAMVGKNLIGPNEFGLYCDYEHSFDPVYTAKITGMEVVHIGEMDDWVNAAKHRKGTPPCFLWCQPMHLEEGTDLAIEFSHLLGPKLRFIVNDSLAAMIPKQILEGAAGDVTIGLQARLLGTFYSKASKILGKRKTTLWVVNQIRMKIGMGYGQMTGEESAGGKATRFYASQRLKMTSGESHSWKSSLPHGSHTSYVKVEKNKTSPHRKGKTMLVVRPGFGLCAEVELLELCIQHGVLKGAGPGHFQFNGKSFNKSELLAMLTLHERKGEVFQMFKDALFKAVPDGQFAFEDPKAGAVAVDLA